MTGNCKIEITRDIEITEKIFADRFVLTDTNVYNLYKDRLKTAKRVFVIDAGEDSKTLKTAEKVLAEMAGAHLDRRSTLVAFGGGVVGDLGGFAAAVYMRGINFINVPTTLLAMLDSSIGGKTGVDLDGFKNMVGAFHLPKAVYICTDFLKTLPVREIKCGLGEAVKTALLDKSCMDEWKKLGGSAYQAADFYSLVEKCARFKESVVKEDFKESGKRKILNLGHTVGHALEYLDKHKKSHGEYVAVGLVSEAAAAYKLGEIKRESLDFIKKQCLPLVADSVKELMHSFSAEEITGAALSDKKNSGGKISVMICEDYKQKELLIDSDKLEEALKSCTSVL